MSKKKSTSQPKAAAQVKAAEPQRVSRKELRRQQVEREKRMRTLRIGIPVSIVVVALLGLAIARLLEPEVEGVVFLESAPANQHDASYQYPLGERPPTGGIHNPRVQNCGIYTEPVAAEYVVHSMEHGAIWVTYQPDLPAEQIAHLQDLVRGRDYLILSPYPGQVSPVVLTGWDLQLELDSASDARVEQFINKYRRVRGPEAGASCSGGVGTPIG